MLDSLINRLKHKEEKAFNEIYYKFKVKISCIIKKYVADPNTINDLMQESFIRMYDNVDKLKHNCAFTKWFFTLTKNLVIEHLKSKSRYYSLNEQKLYIWYDNIEVDAMIDDLYSDLEPLERKIVFKKVILDMNMNEISASLRIDYFKTRRIYHNAIEKLKEGLCYV